MNLINFNKHLIKNVIKPLFKSEGFLVSGLHWRKREVGFEKIINFQMSQFNSSESFLFYVNIGFYFPNYFRLRFSNLLLREEIPNLPKFPKLSDCSFKERDSIIFERSNSFHCDRNTNQEDFINDVIHVVKNVYLPFLDELNSIQSCEAFLFKHYGKPIFQYQIALGYSREKEYFKANEILLKLLSSNIPNKLFLELLNEELLETGNNFNVYEVVKNQNECPKIDLSKRSYP